MDTIIGGAPSGPTWGGLLVAVVVYIPSLVSVVACAFYARRVRSRPAAALFWGSLGGLIASMASFVGRSYLSVLRATTGSTEQYFAVYSRFDTVLAVLSVIGFALSLLFSVALFFVLRDAARHYGSNAGPVLAEPSESGPTQQALQPDAQTSE